MLNQIILVGRLVRTPELFETEKGLHGSFITLAVARSFKNSDGEYDTDFLDCSLWTNVAENTAEYCKAGDIIGIRGRVQSKIVLNEDGSKTKQMEIIADRVTFLSSGKGNKEVDDEEVTSASEDSTDNADSDKGNKKKK